MSVESIQDIYLKDLTEDQRAAVLTNGEVIVSAAAGSGKTKAMIFRVMRLLAESALQKDPKKRISLKNSVDFSLIRRNIVDSFPIEKDITGSSLKETSYNAKRCCFATAGRAEQSEKFFIFDA